MITLWVLLTVVSFISRPNQWGHLGFPGLVKFVEPHGRRIFGWESVFQGCCMSVERQWCESTSDETSDEKLRLFALVNWTYYLDVHKEQVHFIVPR